MRFQIFQTLAYSFVAAILSMGLQAHAQSDTTNQQLLERTNKQEQQIEQLQKQLQELHNNKMNLTGATQVSPNGNNASIPGANMANVGMVHQGLDSELVSLIEYPEKFRIVDNTATTLGIYGTAEVTLNFNSGAGPYVTEIGSGGANQSWFGVDRPWLSANKWGINGTHVLDHESNTVLLLRLESEFYEPNGNMDSPGTIFNRDAWVGIQSPMLGKITVGRQNTVARDINAIWAQPNDVARANLTEIGWFDNDAVVTPKTYFESGTGSRTDASAVWKKQWAGDWITSIGYVFNGNRNSSDGTKSAVVYVGDQHQDEATLGLAYNSPSNFWHVSGTATHTTINTYAKNVFALGANVTPMPWLRLNGGMIYAAINQADSLGSRRDNAYAVSMQINPGEKFEFVLGVNYVMAKKAGIDANGNTLAPFDGADAAVSTADGTFGTAYSMFLYRIDKVTTAYVAMDYAQQKDGYVNGTFNGANNGSQFGIGLRYKF